MPRETERHQRNERRTHEFPASSQPLITSDGEKVKSKHPLLYRREKDRLTTNARKVRRPSLRLELKFLVYCRQDVESRRVIIGILPCIVSTSLEAGASMWIIAFIDMLIVRRNPANRRKVRVVKEQLRFWKRERSKVVYLKIQIQRSLFCGKLGKRDWTLRRVTSSNSGKKSAISRRYPKRWTSWAKSLRAEVWGKNTWRNLTTRRARPQSSMEFGEKNI